MKFNEVAEMYFENTKGIMKPGSWNNRYWMFKSYIEDYFCGVEISEINSRYVQKYYNSIANLKKINSDEIMSSKSIREIVNLVKTICYYAMDEGIIDEFKLRLKKPYNLNDNEISKREYMPKDDYYKLINVCCELDFRKPRIKAKLMALIALTSGLRIGEICGIKWNDIDFENNIIYVNRTVQRIYNCQNKSTELVIGPPKSKTSKRKAVLVELTKSALNKYKQHLIDKDMYNENYYVLGKESPDEPRTLRSQYEKLLKSLEIEYIHPHALRHTFCTYALENGCDIKIVSKLLGHSNTSITLDIYTHVTESQMQNTIQKLNMIPTNSPKS